MTTARTHWPPRAAETDGPVDHALTLLLADETEAAALERTPLAPSAVIVTSRLLERMGRARAAVEGLRMAARQAIERRDLPLAVVAIQDLAALGVDATPESEEVAAAFCKESPRLDLDPVPEANSAFGDFQ